MLTRTYALDASLPAFSLTGVSEAESIFFDIETTGFRPETSHVYLIGAAHHTSRGWRLTQWISERPTEESALLRTFASYLKPYRNLIHFNGDRFDIPYLQEKYAQYAIPTPLGGMHSIDIYRSVRPLRTFLGLSHMNQTTLERFLGETREDRFDGGQLIQVYRDWCKTSDEARLQLLLLHNREDVRGMTGLLRLFAYLQLPAFRSAKGADSGIAAAAAYSETARSLTLSLTFPQPFPLCLDRPYPWGSLRLSGHEAVLTVPVLAGELFHFFPDYQNYYYLPQEDEAIHKSVAAYVDKAFRRQATARTCYTRRTGLFLPQMPVSSGSGQKHFPFTPVFLRRCDDSLGWLPYPEDDLRESFVAHYAAHLLENI